MVIVDSAQDVQWRRHQLAVVLRFIPRNLYKWKEPGTPLTSPRFMDIDHLCWTTFRDRGTVLHMTSASLEMMLFGQRCRVMERRCLWSQTLSFVQNSLWSCQLLQLYSISDTLVALCKLGFFFKEILAPRIHRFQKD